ncbi:hypothetical protein KDH_21690 [Dictyobacter sp. S3.2.2.5]|uniref:Uncharacterized protein n=1 Tax=Dictyobacter halimunensis TaxID=3026934 RepID=A0ABQ6FNP5_9CHLR|nr:hypothetical protein KDH_21690 [Dictyobacter sp. S3.2.2.5]
MVIKKAEGDRTGYIILLYGCLKECANAHSFKHPYNKISAAAHAAARAGALTPPVKSVSDTPYPLSPPLMPLTKKRETRV